MSFDHSNVPRSHVTAGALATQRHDLSGIVNARNERILQSQCAMSIEELIARCTSLLNSMDKDLRARLEGQNKRKDNLETLSDFSQRITALGPVPDVTKSQEDFDKWTKESAALVKDMQKAAKNTALAGSLNNALSALGSGDKTAAQNAVSILSSEMDKIRGGNEISMIEIQSIISKRSQALQMTSNMINAMNESAKAITQNIR